MTITFETTGPTATLTGVSVIKSGSQVPVTFNFTTNGSPSVLAGTPAIEMGISQQSSSPALLAFLDTFTALTPNTYTGILNANDSRLVTAMASTQSAAMNMEVAVTIEGEEYIAPNLVVTVQQGIIGGAPSGEGGPSYVTTTMLAAAVAGLAGSAAAVNLPQGGTVNIAPGSAFLNFEAPLEVGAGTGSYAQAVSISDGNAINGSVMFIPMDFAASANGTVNISDAGGNVLEGPLVNYDPANAHSFLLIARFDGTAWHKMWGAWVP